MSRPRIESFVAGDGYRFFVRVWDAAPADAGVFRESAALEPSAASRPLARVFFLHGIISHGGWYEPTCARIAAAGREVHFLDRRGSGLNAAARGDVDVYQTWVRDVVEYVESASADGRPAILAGISWGGKLALAVAQQRPDLLAGLALICPGMFSSYGAGVVQRLGVALASRTSLRRLRVAIPLRDPRLFADDPASQARISQDPLVLRQLTLRAAAANSALGRVVERAAQAALPPILLMLAGRDRIIDNRATRQFLDNLKNPHKRLVEYPEAAHTIEFTASFASYADAFVEWCNRIDCATLENLNFRGSER